MDSFPRRESNSESASVSDRLTCPTGNLRNTDLESTPGARDQPRNSFDPQRTVSLAGATLSPDFRWVQGSGRFIVGDQVSTYTYSDSSGPRSFLLGPMVEIAVARDVFVEGDAIYRPMRSRSETGSDGEMFSGSRTIQTWNLPVLVKY